VWGGCGEAAVPPPPGGGASAWQIRQIRQIYPLPLPTSGAGAGAGAGAGRALVVIGRPSQGLRACQLPLPAMCQQVGVQQAIKKQEGAEVFSGFGSGSRSRAYIASHSHSHSHAHLSPLTSASQTRGARQAAPPAGPRWAPRLRSDPLGSVMLSLSMEWGKYISITPLSGHARPPRWAPRGHFAITCLPGALGFCWV
jgi:hypothetical protein